MMLDKLVKQRLLELVANTGKHLAASSLKAV